MPWTASLAASLTCSAPTVPYSGPIETATRRWSAVGVGVVAGRVEIQVPAYGSRRSKLSRSSLNGVLDAGLFSACRGSWSRSPRGRGFRSRSTSAVGVDRRRSRGCGGARGSRR